MSSKLVRVLLNTNNIVPLLHMHMQWGQTALYYASAKGHSEVVKLLVQAGADLELQYKVHTLWERLILALAVCDIVAWDKANINKLLIKVPAGTC